MDDVHWFVKKPADESISHWQGGVRDDRDSRPLHVVADEVHLFAAEIR